MNVRLAPDAEADLAESWLWYRRRGVQAAERFMHAVAATLSLIERHPEGQPVLYRAARRALLPRFPYALLYYLDEDEAVVFGCFHSARDPRIWQQRADAALE